MIPIERRITSVVAVIAVAAALAFQPTDTVRKKQEVIQSTDLLERKEHSNRQVPVTLVEAIDGDTIKVRVNGKTETVRYLLVDTPESKKPGLCVQPYAKEASVRNNELVRGGQLTVEFEQRRTRDEYGRLLAYVYTDGHLVQQTLLKEGLARVAYILNPPYQYLALLVKDEKIAKSNHMKIWSKQGYVTRWGFVGCVDEWAH